MMIKTSYSEEQEDFKEFHRRLELVQFFKPNEEHTNTDLGISQSIIDFMNANNSKDQDDDQTLADFEHIHKKFKNKSTWKPYPPNKTLDTFTRSFKVNLLESWIHHPTHNNLSKEQWKGILDLKQNPDIVIKKADKSSAIVIMNTTDYLKEGYRQLGDKNFYTKLKEDPTMDISKKICDVLTEMKTLKLISQKNFDYLNIKEPRTADSIYCRKFTKRMYLEDQYVVLLGTIHVISANLWMPTLRTMYPIQNHMLGTPNTLSVD